MRPDRQKDIVSNIDQPAKGRFCEDIAQPSESGQLRPEFSKGHPAIDQIAICFPDMEARHRLHAREVCGRILGLGDINPFDRLSAFAFLVKADLALT